MNQKYISVVYAAFLVCLVLKLGQAHEPGSDAGNGTATAAEVDTDAADANVNTYFRTQDKITTTDGSTEQNIPGLAPTDYKKVWRSIPNVEHLSPMITSVVPILPNMKTISLSMGWHFPMAWPLAGASGEHKDWLTTAFSVYTRALLRMGPRPLVYPTILVPSHEAYKKLAADMKQHSGLPDLASVQDPAKKAVMAAAVYQQLMTNLIVVATPLLASAENGTVMTTQGKVKLMLVVKPDGSRHLVSNTTSLRLKAMDVGCERCGPLTIQLVDSFVVPKMSPVPIGPDPIMSQEDIDKFPEHLRMVQEGWAQAPKAIAAMPKALWEMGLRQLPDSHQALFQKLSHVQSQFSLNVRGQQAQRGH